MIDAGIEEFGREPGSETNEIGEGNDVRNFEALSPAAECL